MCCCVNYKLENLNILFNKLLFFIFKLYFYFWNESFNSKEITFKTNFLCFETLNFTKRNVVVSFGAFYWKLSLWESCESGERFSHLISFVHIPLSFKKLSRLESFPQKSSKKALPFTFQQLNKKTQIRTKQV